MRSDEPTLFILVRHCILYVLQIVVRGQVQGVACRDVIIDQLGSILNHSESLVRIILLSRLDVNEVLLDVLLLFSKSFLLFQHLLLVDVVTLNPGFGLAEVTNAHLLLHHHVTVNSHLRLVLGQDFVNV